MQKKEKLSIPLFVSASILVLIFLSAFYFFADLSLSSFLFTKSIEGDKVYLNEKEEEGDPLLTKVDNLKDVLAGPIISQNDPMLGNNQAKVALVIFSDFQCAVCQKQEAVFKQIVEKYKEKVRLIWKDYPDKNVSSPSFQASLAGRCANEQGKFYPYHDLLFANSQQLNRDKFLELARQLDLKEKDFKTCLESEKYKKEVNDNILEANALDINGVPFIYVNDKEIMGEIDVDELSKMVEMELKK